MVWGAFVEDKLLDLVVCEGTQDSTKYIEVLNKSLVPSMNHGPMFMHDGASVHRSNLTKNGSKKRIFRSLFGLRIVRTSIQLKIFGGS